jgi:hypothetical protein
MPQTWLAERLGMKSAANVSQLIRRASLGKIRLDSRDGVRGARAERDQSACRGAIGSQSSGACSRDRAPFEVGAEVANEASF